MSTRILWMMLGALAVWLCVEIYCAWKRSALYDLSNDPGPERAWAGWEAGEGVKPRVIVVARGMRHAGDLVMRKLYSQGYAFVAITTNVQDHGAALYRTSAGDVSLILTPLKDLGDLSATEGAMSAGACDE